MQKQHLWPALACLALLAADADRQAQARTYRSCTMEMTYEVQHVLVHGRLWLLDEVWEVDAWVPVVPRVEAEMGDFVFRASAPSGQPNRARMRASRKAELCEEDIVNNLRCLDAAEGHSFDPHEWILYQVVDAACAELAIDHPAGLRGHWLKGQILSRIDGNRCCRDSDRNCPYAYGINRTANALLFNPYGTRSVVWGDDTHFEINCAERDYHFTGLPR